ncbi:DUF2200 domain-containing protein [Mammaliicoccus stepanovicii]|uniref:Uncharacterized protein conserved in bacteria n=1 Tax=Mammaliicoccus stepanovicii TaxID=643214 RepID=A0A239YEE8_9STAP|nr:DUF2200 domain-containing protein [Mammaliicoccus stepanovicii]PNZ75530.1 DUF2200 domain-containing protein [Mammaliicoccus stepanovicii]GGI42603.1 hypothetical protein GCM10010896_19240 [Mammaliicoccus stepanovicii]SNV56584.1 Uncharacterized protein conserved in bacteria [Mammaliicoccus stepanovicii]
MSRLEKVYAMPFSSVYPHLINKVEKKGKTKEDVHEIITWLTGYSDTDIERILENRTNYETFFKEAPHMNPNRKLIKGVICGYRVEDIEEPIMQEIRYLDKLIDELARGKKKENIFRTEK